MAKQIMRPQMQPKVIDDFVERSFIKLKQLYPDFLVVGLAERDKTLNWQLERLARRLGYAELADLLRQCGFDLPADSQNLILHPIPQSEATEQSETPPASAALQSALDKLAQLYPEHKIFALDALDRELQDKLAKLAQQAGLPNIRDLLRPYGYEFIAGNAVKELRSTVIYTPGNEPEIIKSKVQNMLNRLENYYPEHIIPRMIETDHKRLAQNVSALYRWLGYADTKAMLAAYGFDYQKGENGSVGGRPAAEFQPMLDALLAKYQNQPKPTSLGALMYENPEYKSRLKTMSNRSQEIFGMTLNKYLRQLGILADLAENKQRSEKNLPNRVLQTLAERYAQPEAAAYGTYEQAEQALAAFSVQRGRNGLLCITGLADETQADCGEELFIPYGIDHIGVEAFQGQKNLRRVVLPAGLRQIAYRAFAGCSNLAEVIMPAEPPEIEAAAFLGTPYDQAQRKGEQATSAAEFTYIFNAKHQVTITGYTGSSSKVIIPDQIEGCLVTAIAKGAFQERAFQENQYLTEVFVPDSVVNIQGLAFKDCISLKKVRLSNNLRRIVVSTFNGCIGLKEINIPDSVCELKDNTFQDAPLETLHIGKGLASINTRAFYRGEYDFEGRRTDNRAIWNVSIDPQNVNLRAEGSCIFSADGRHLLAALGALTDYLVPEGVETIAEGAFSGLRSLTDITLPTSLREIGARAFEETGLRSVSFGENLQSIGDHAFDFCEKLTSAIFAEGLRQIGRRAFAYCPIVSVSLPASLQSLGNGSFDCLNAYNSEQRQEFYIAEDNPCLKADGTALYTRLEDGWRLQKAYGREISNYNNGFIQLALGSYIVAPQTTVIAAEAFCNCNNLGQLILPDTLRVIEDKAFYNCDVLQSINLPAGLTKIGNEAFKGTNIASFELPASLREIGVGAFLIGNEWDVQQTRRAHIQVDAANPCFYVDAEHQALLRRRAEGGSVCLLYFGSNELVSLPTEVVEIAPLAFCNSLMQEMCLPARLVAIGEDAFKNCRQLKRLRVEFDQPENGLKQAIIYIPGDSPEDDEYDDDYDYAAQSLRNQYLDCIRVNDGRIFDFVKYDSLFAGISDFRDKILVATDRLKSAIQLVPLYRDNYLTYLQNHAEQAVNVVVEFDDLAGLNMLAELGVFTGQNIDSVIELANQSRQADILSYLLNYKNTHLAMNENQDDLYEL